MSVPLQYFKDFSLIRSIWNKFDNQRYHGLLPLDSVNSTPMSYDFIIVGFKMAAMGRDTARRVLRSMILLVLLAINKKIANKTLFHSSTNHIILKY